MRDAVIPTQVRYRRLNEDQLQRYVQVDAPIGCAGAFKIEAAGIALFESVRSDDPSALIGLPLIALVSILAEYGLAPFATLRQED